MKVVVNDDVYTRLPFNWQTPLGYLIAMYAQSLAVYYTLVCATLNLGLLGGLCWLFISFVEEISQDLSILNVDKLAKQNHQDLLKSYSNIVQTYEDVKQLSA